jgi:hypothetical protein
MEEELEVKMKDLKQILLAAIALCVLSASAMALEPQRNEQKPPPPKDEKKVEKPEKPPPPPREGGNNRGDNSNRRGKP